ncbi:MAG: hypothetical protein IJX17_08365 [Clostridia bacterium]|nr:hypothetical protein [Clostridia bacterium]
MNNFIKNALKEVKDIDNILIVVTDKNLKEKGKKHISKNFDALFHAVDLELKGNDELNTLINESVKIKEILTYDVKDSFTYAESFYYGGEDVTTGYKFNEEEFNYAKKHIENWGAEKQKLQDKVAKINSSSFLKFISGGRLDRLESQIKTGDARFERYKKIFDKEEEMKKVDKPALEKELREKLQAIKGTINDVIEKHIIEAIKADPSIVAYDAFVDSKPFISSSEGETKHNKNIYKYFDSREIAKKLAEILEAYNKKKSLESSTEKENQDGIEMGQ